MYKKFSNSIKKYLQAFLIFLVLTELFTACAKEPVSDFSTNKEEYLAGDTVVLTNNSSDAESCKWIIPGGEMSSRDAKFKLDPELNDGTITITLESYSRNNKKVSKSTKTIPVFASGQITFRSSSSGFPKIIYVDDVRVGSISKEFDPQTGCELGSCFTTLIKVGPHNIKSAGGGAGTGGITIAKGDKAVYNL